MADSEKRGDEAPAHSEEEMLPPAPVEDDEPFSLGDYLVVNVIFLAFLGLIHFTMRRLYPDTGGLSVFFILTGIGFIIVSIYDFAFDRLSRRGEERDQTS